MYHVCTCSSIVDQRKPIEMIVFRKYGGWYCSCFDDPLFFWYEFNLMFAVSWCSHMANLRCMVILSVGLFQLEDTKECAENEVYIPPVSSLSCFFLHHPLHSSIHIFNHPLSKTIGNAFKHISTASVLLSKVSETRSGSEESQLPTRKPFIPPAKTLN